MAATAGAIRTGRAFVELFTEDSAMMKGLRSAKRKFEAWSSAIARIAAASMAGAAALATPLVAATKAWSDMASEMVDAADRTGASVSSLSELRFAAEQSGASFEDLEVALRKMNITIAEAESGSKPARQALAALGLSAHDLAKLKPDERIAKIAEALSKIASPGKRASIAMDIFGKSAAKLLPLLSLGAKGISDLRKQAQDLGLTLNDEDARAAEAFGDELAQLVMVIGRIRVILGSALLPVMRSFVNAAIDGAKVAAKWVNEHKGIAQIALTAAVGLAAFSVALTPLSALLKGAAIVTGFFASAWLSIGQVLGVAGKLITATSAALKFATATTFAAARSLQLLTVSLNVMKASWATAVSVFVAAKSAIAAMTVATMTLGPALLTTAAMMRTAFVSGLVAIHAAVLATRAAVIAFPAAVRTAMVTARVWIMSCRAAIVSLRMSFTALQVAAAMAFTVLSKNPLRSLSVVLQAVRGAVAGLIPMLIALGLKIAFWGLLLYGVAAAAKAVFPMLVSAGGSAISWITSKFVGFGSTVRQMFNGFGGWAGTAFSAVKGFAVEAAGDSVQAWKVVQDAIASGDWGTAAKVMWSLIKLEWARGVNALQASWQQAKTWILDIWDAISDGISLGWIELTSFLTKTWASTVAGFQSTLASAQNAIADKIVGLMAMFDSSIDPDDVRKTLQEDFTRSQKTIGENNKRAQQGANDAREKGLQEWNQADQARKQAREQQADKNIADAAEELKKAQEDFGKVLRDGRAKIAEDRPGTGEADPKATGLGLGGVQKTTGQQMEGTFSNLAGRMLTAGTGMGGVEQTLRDILQEQRAYNKKLNQLLKPAADPQLLLRT
ncbi:hypothetical protein Pan44_26660 [Caulifigura coniformis]|uniref:Phage-related minor tail protein n=1 Tax=Caulifigura coniformis TaxID=2527983 RepID=A0A517SES5_9PLAN|nr:hypothetical protein [Caulifigura coniformis]QDT54631.1 hypothetical protein Pan44_26660 [Caulifigura coniformis]